MLAPNSTLQDRYLIVRELGHGGMGTVYEAIDQRVSCVVALKQTLVGPNDLARMAFRREAALLANLRHASLPKVMDYFSEGDGEFLVMEYIAGTDLAQLLEDQAAPFSQDQVLVWADELLKLLDFLHTREPPIVHRDIKPANLKVTSGGEIFLLDFGLAKGAAGQMPTVRTDQSVHGYTPLYAPLEQIHGQGTDPRTDIYSLGATLYDLLAGQPPVSAPARFEAIENERPDPLPPVNRLNSLVSSPVAEVIQRAMALSRRNRFSSAAEMRDALQRARQTMADLAAARAAAEKALEENRRDSDTPLITDSNVEFTVYSPRQIKPEKNYTMLAFAHLAKKRDDAPADEPDPIEEMKDQAARILGKQQADYDDAKEPSGQPVPREGEITFVPIVPGITFSPASRTFTWRKSVHREEFDLWVAPDLNGKSLHGQMTVFLGSLVIAEVPLKILVDSRAESAAEKISLDAPQSGRRLRQIFASYSHQDEQVVAELAHVAPLFGSRFLMDRTHLEPGEDRREGLQRLIRGADMFQLFWSTNAMRSADTVDEINYAVSLQRPGFILPTYWEEPLPRSPADELPPPAIERLQFHRIYPGAISQAAFGGKSSHLVILAPAGSEVFIDDERQGSTGNSGRLILRSIKTGKHILRVTRPGYRDDERIVDIKDGVDEQVIEAQFHLADTVGAAPSHVAAPSRGEPIGFGYSELDMSARTGSLEEVDDVSPTAELGPIQKDVVDTAPLEVPGKVWASPVDQLQSPPSYQAPDPALRTATPEATQVYDRGKPTVSEMRAPETPAVPPASRIADGRAAILVCTVCLKQFTEDLKFCTHCGSSLQPLGAGAAGVQVVLSEIQHHAPAPQNFNPASAAKPKRRIMMPILAGIATVLFVAIVGPVWYLMNLTRANLGSAPPTTSSSNSNQNRSAHSNTNASANVAATPNATAITPSRITPPADFIRFAKNEPAYLEPAQTQEVDLDGDGTPELLAQYEFCGSGGCAIHLFQRSGNGFKDISGDVLEYMFPSLNDDARGSFSAGPKSSNGFLDLRYRFKNGGPAMNFKFDGRQYRGGP